MLLNIFLLTLLVVLPTAGTIALIRMDRNATKRAREHFDRERSAWTHAA